MLSAVGQKGPFAFARKIMEKLENKKKTLICVDINQNN